MICVKCRKPVYFEEKDYAKIVTSDKATFYHGVCFSQVFYRKEVNPISPCQGNDTATHVSPEPSA